MDRIDAATIAVVIDTMAAERAELLALLGSLSEAEWAQSTECPEYPVKGIAAHILGDDLSLGGIKKHDLDKGVSVLHSEGDDRVFMEPVFVPRSDDASEDDGWVLAFVYDQAQDRSDVVILAAQDFEAGPVATVHLPRRVPYGFHGIWRPSA